MVLAQLFQKGLDHGKGQQRAGERQKEGESQSPGEEHKEGRLGEEMSRRRGRESLTEQHLSPTLGSLRWLSLIGWTDKVAFPTVAARATTLLLNIHSRNPVADRVPRAAAETALASCRLVV